MHFEFNTPMLRVPAWKSQSRICFHAHPWTDLCDVSVRPAPDLARCYDHVSMVFMEQHVDEQRVGLSLGITALGGCVTTYLQPILTWRPCLYTLQTNSCAMATPVSDTYLSPKKSKILALVMLCRNKTVFVSRSLHYLCHTRVGICRDVYMCHFSV